MRLNEISFDGGLPIDGYGPGFFRVAGQVYESGVVVSPSGVRVWDGTDPAPLLEALSHGVDILFVGTGAEVAHLEPELRQTLEATGHGVEAMGSPAAARTYNVLLSEGRRVAVALRPV